MNDKLILSTNWNRPFFAVWSGQAFSLIGSGLVQFALIRSLTEKTESADPRRGYWGTKQFRYKPARI